MHARPGHILIVDDDPLNRRVLTKSLDSDGHRTTDVDNGFAALTALEADPPDVVLLDVVMPGLDGGQVASQLRQQPALREVPIIFISGIVQSNPETTSNLPRLNGFPFLSKPVQIEAVIACIEENLSHLS